MGLIKQINNSIKAYLVNKQVSKYKYVHIMFNEKFNKSFVDFLNRNFNKNEHVILCKQWNKKFPFPKGKNVIKIRTLKGLNFENNNKIICHSLFDTELVDYLYEHPDILTNKTYWFIWGGDVYNAPDNEKNNFVRKNFKGYISDTDGKCEVAINKYGSHGTPQYTASYNFPITQDMLDNAKREAHNYTKIQINNSADKTTLEMLDILSKFKNENIKITTILSYGQLEYREEIIELGKRLFSSKFEYADTYMSPQEYAKFLAQNDIYILNQDREQGYGNTVVALAKGSKVFVKSQVATYGHYNSKGITVYDTNKLKDMTYEDFISYPDNIKNINIQKIQVLCDEKYLKEMWNKIFIQE